MTFETPPSIDVLCSECGSPMRKRSGSYGEFYGCVKFPVCRRTLSVEQAEQQRQQTARVLAARRGKKGGSLAPRDAAEGVPLENRNSLALPKVSGAKIGFVAFNRHIAVSAAEKWGLGIEKLPGSEEQEKIWEALIERDGHLVIEATAGAGKTHTAQQGCLRLGGEVEFLTYHSLGLRAIRKAHPSTRVDQWKVRELIEQMDEQGDLQPLLRRTVSKENWPKVKSLTGKLVGYVKNYMLEPEDRESLEALVDMHDVDTEGGLENALDLLPEVVGEDLLALKFSVDFDDMIWAPVKLGLAVPKFEVLMIDEAQDTSRPQQELALRSTVETGGRLVVIGDSRQAIYGFRGSDTESIPRLERALGESERGVERLGLTVTRRCPKSHVRLAQTQVPYIKAMEDAPEGRVLVAATEDVAVGMLRSGDMVLSRINAPLIPIAYQLIARGVRPLVRGRDIGEGLVALVERVKREQGLGDEDEVEVFLGALRGHVREEVGKLVKLGEKGEGRIEALQDKTGCVEEFASRAKDVSGVVRAIKGLFAEFDQEGKPREAVVLGSVHRCVHPDTLVETCDGLIRIADIEPSGWIATPRGVSYYHSKFTRQETPTIKFTTKRGYEIETSLDHGLTVWKEGKHRRVSASDIRVGDWLRLHTGHLFDGDALDPEAMALHDSPKYDARTRLHKLPRVLTGDLAELLGLLVADGTIYSRGFRVVKEYQSVVNRFQTLVHHVFGVRIKNGFNYETRPGKPLIPRGEVHSTQLAKWLLDFGGLSPNAKDVPSIILRAPLKLQRRFLRGLFEDGTVNHWGDLVDHIHWENKSDICARKVQTMLLRLGIVASRRVRDKVTTLYIYSDSARKFAKEVGFIAPEKNRKLLKFRPDTSLLMPVTREEIIVLKGCLSNKAYYNTLTRGFISRHTLEQALKRLPKDKRTPYLEKLTWVYQQVKSVKSGVSGTVCVTVPDGERFFQNGFDGWNSKGLEAERVFILRPDLIPHPKARQKWAQEQERNLAYVAVTRAKYEKESEGSRESGESGVSRESGVLVFVGGVPEMFQSAGVKMELCGLSAGLATDAPPTVSTLPDLPIKQIPDNISEDLKPQKFKPEKPARNKGLGKEPRRDAKTARGKGTGGTGKDRSKRKSASNA